MRLSAILIRDLIREVQDDHLTGKLGKIKKFKGGHGNVDVNMRFIVPPLLKEHGCITWSTEYKVSSCYIVLKAKLKRCVFSLLLKAAVS